MSRAEELTDEQWELIAPLLPQTKRTDGRGRPRIEDRAVLNGIFYLQSVAGIKLLHVPYKGGGPAVRA